MVMACPWTPKFLTIKGVLETEVGGIFVLSLPLGPILEDCISQKPKFEHPNS